MSKESFLASEIEVGLLGNKISTHTDGSMVFADRFVPGVRLVDLIQGEVVVDPAIGATVPSSSWQYSYTSDVGTPIYTVTAYFGYMAGTPSASFTAALVDTWAETSPQNIFVEGTITNGDGTVSPIQFHTIKTSTSSVKIESSEKLTCNIRIKRI